MEHERALLQLYRSLELGREQGVESEFDHFLPEGWSCTYTAGTYRIRGAPSDRWETQVQDLIRVLGYHSGLVSRRLDASSWEVVTWRPSGEGFRLLFLAHGVPDADNVPPDVPPDVPEP